MAASPDGSVRKASWRSASAASTLTRIARYSTSSGRAAEVAREQYGEPVRQAPVGVVRRVLGRERWPEIDEREAGDAPLHRQVLVEHRVDGGPPVGGGEVREPGRDAVGVGVQVAQGEGVDERALVGEEPVDGADGHLGALRDGPGGELLVSGLVEEACAGVEYPGQPVGAALLHGGAAEVRVDMGHGPHDAVPTPPGGRQRLPGGRGRRPAPRVPRLPVPAARGAARATNGAMYAVDVPRSDSYGST